MVIRFLSVFEYVFKKIIKENEIERKRRWGKVKMNFLHRESHTCCK